MKIGVGTMIAVLLSINSFAQEIRRCGNAELFEVLKLKKPELAQRIQQTQTEYFNTIFQKKSTANKSTAQVTIPVIFHFVLTQQQLTSIGDAAGVAERVDSQIAVLNRDFNAQSLDYSSIPPIFQSLYGNAQIQFGLAHTAPDGSATPGYEIKITTSSSYSIQNGTAGSGLYASDAKYVQTGGAASWDANKYLNIWVINFTQTGLLGVSPPMSWVTTAGFSLKEIGPVINYRALGKASPAQTNFLTGYNGGRTLVHEMGHFFELNHIWGNTNPGSGNCNDDDGVGDTPLQEDANMSCASFPKSNCTNALGGEMFMNFMDYVNDACYRMFTIQQAGVMNFSASNSLGYAYSLSQNTHLLQWPTSVKDIEKERQITIYPNPSQGVFRITTMQQKAIEKIVITNTLGQVVKTIEATDKAVRNYDVDLTGMSKGIYQVRCTFDDGIVTQKIVLQ